MKNLPDACALHETIYAAAGRLVDTLFVDINPAFEVLTGFTRAEVLGKQCSGLFDLHWEGSY